VVEIASPTDEIESLISQASNLYEQAQSALRTTKGPVGPVIGDYVVKKYIPHGYKQAARSIGRDILKDMKSDSDANWRQQGVSLKDTAVRKVSRMSINTKNLTLSGNSKKLIVKFNRLSNIKTALAYIRNLFSVLDGLKGLDLIWNDDIENELQRRFEEKQWLREEEERLKMEAGAILEESKRAQFSKKSSVLQRLKPWPRPLQSLISAFNRLTSTDPEAPRHCISSARVAIEQLCIDAGGDGDWKKGLANITSSKSDRKQVKAVYHNLSGKGSHGGHNPTQKEAEQCLALTLTTLEILLDKIETKQ
jgi:hypothetical protein